MLVIVLPCQILSKVKLFLEDQSQLLRAQSLSDELGLKLIFKADDNSFCLTIGKMSLFLLAPKKMNLSPLQISFNEGKLKHRLKSGIGIKQNIAKAIGVKHDFKPKILDVTAGMGADAFVLASLGCRVHMLERNPIIATLLEDGLARSVSDNKVGKIITQNMSLSRSDILKNRVDFQPDVVYLDPMFSNNSNRRLSGKNMQYFREIAGVDADADDLLEVALSLSAKRIVVKRSRKDDSLKGRKPSHQIKGRTTRYDVYM